MKRCDLLAFGLACIMFSAVVYAANNSDPAGIWKWSLTREDNVVVDFSLKLKHADGKLTGTVTLPNKNDVTIDDATFKDGEVAFSVTQEGPMSRKIITKYKGKLDGDTIKGKAELTRRGETTSRDWEPKREKP